MSDLLATGSAETPSITRSPWTPHAVEFVTDLDRPELAVSPWGGHRWFGYDLVRWAKPDRIVELGTHYGCSYFAFCQALLADQSNCEAIAIDTWEGEEHSGLYGEEVFQFFTKTLERRFAGVNTRVQRSLFDDALDLVADGSVDILHIDGLHTYDAVRHDYETWKDKVAPNGIVLFHDVAPSSGYGSSTYWQEIKEGRPNFAFMHSFGLGVLLPNGTEGREPLLELGRSQWRSFYEFRAGYDLYQRQVDDLSTMVDARDEALSATEELVVARDEALTAAQAMVGDRDEALLATEQLVMERDSALSSVQQLLEQRERDLFDAHEELTAAGNRIVAAEQQTLDATATVDRQRRELKRAADDQKRLEDELSQAMTALDREVQRAEADRANTQAEMDHLHHHIAALTEDRDGLAAGLELYRKTLKPVRWAAGPPRKILRRLRGTDMPLDAPELPALTAPDDSRPDLFDPEWYLTRYPDVARAGIDPWTHWSEHGWKEGREPCPLFNAGTYLERHPDVAASGMDPLVHWIDHGAPEGRDPSSLFQTGFYRDGHDGDEPALPADTNPLAHYLEVGMAEGRCISDDHERRILGRGPLEGRDDEVLVDVSVHLADGTSRSVPYQMVMDLDADLFTFDLWDTILTRSRPADASKLATARRIRLALGISPEQGPSTWDLMRRRVEIEAEIAGPSNGEYLLGDVLVQQLSELMATDGDDQPVTGGAASVSALADFLRRAELEDEMAATTPIGETVLVMEKLLGRGGSTQVAVVSDFYLGGDDLRELLAYHGIGDDVLPVISSADVGMSKHAKGALLAWTREQFDIAADRHVHVGDNFHSDVAMQTETGGTGVYLAHGNRRFVSPGGLSDQNMSEVAAELAVDLDAAAELRCRQSGLRPRPQNRIVRAAWRTALLPVALVAAAIEDAEARGLDRVHYISREGLFLSRIHQQVAPILAPQGHAAPVHLAVSRRSTFGPSLTEISPDSLLDLWRMYSRQTPRGLLVSLGADADDYRDQLRRHNLPVDDTIDGVHLDDRVRSFLGDGEVRSKLEELNGRRRAALVGYLGHETDLAAEELMVVDVGWRGTVQDNLARMLPDSRFVGWYLALFPFLNPQPANCSKFAIGPDGNRGDEFAYMEPPAAVERPWTPPAPSVVDYRAGDGARSVPVLDEESLNPQSRAAIELYQDAVGEAAPMVARWVVSNGAATDVLRPLVADRLDQYYRNPEPGIADLWFDSAHDDTFGVLNVTSFGKDRPDRRWFNDGLGPGFLRQVENGAEGSLWPAGYRRWRPVEAAMAVEKALRSRSFD